LDSPAAMGGPPPHCQPSPLHVHNTPLTTFNAFLRDRAPPIWAGGGRRGLGIAADPPRALAIAK